MTKYKFNYLVYVQFLGFRYHGWAKQPQQRTIHGAIDKTLTFVFQHDQFKTLGAGRTDAMVSAQKAAFELFVHEPIDKEDFIASFNSNGPSDIKVLDMVKVDSSFNIIQSPKVKEYVYLFSYGEKAHPFSTSMIATFEAQLNIDDMQIGAKLFEGKHNFKKYCTKPSASTQFERTILKSEIVPNTLYTANFFPKQTWAFRVQGAGFMRYQLRLMMGQLVALGKGEITMDTLKESLLSPDDIPLRQIAPASGLILYDVRFKDCESD